MLCVPSFFSSCPASWCRALSFWSCSLLCPVTTSAAPTVLVGRPALPHLLCIRRCLAIPRAFAYMLCVFSFFSSRPASWCRVPSSWSCSLLFLSQVADGYPNRLRGPFGGACVWSSPTIRGRRLPSVGEVFLLPSGALDSIKASSDDTSSEYTFIMRLPGASEDTGALNCALLTSDGGLRLDHASGMGALFSIGPVSLPEECPLLIPIVAEMLESPPHFGPRRAYAAGLDCLRLDLFFRYPRLGHIIIHPLTNLGPYPPWRDSLESLVTHVLGLPFLCYRAPQARVLRLIQAWILSLPDTPISAVFFPRYAESAVDRYLRRSRPCDVPVGPLFRGTRPIDLVSLFPHYRDLSTLPEVPSPLCVSFSPSSNPPCTSVGPALSLCPRWWWASMEHSCCRAFYPSLPPRSAPSSACTYTAYRRRAGPLPR